MKNLLTSLFILTVSVFSASATITLEEIASNKYKATTMPQIVSSADGKYYAIANPEKTMIFKCNGLVHRNLKYVFFNMF